MRSLSIQAVLTSIAVISGGSPGGAAAAPVVTYDFNGTEHGINDPATNGGTAAEFGPSFTAAGVVASNVTATGGGTTTGVRVGNDDQGVYPDQALLVGTTGSNAFSDTDFFSITLSPGAGNTLDLDSLTLDAARGGGSARGFRVRSSLDGFTANLNDPATETIATQRPVYTAYTIDLGAAAFNDLQAPIDFRFYVYSSATNNTVEFDDVTFNGAVAAIPEPASAALVGLGGLLALRRRR